MDRFETQFEDLDVATGYYENATTSATAVGTPQEDVDRLMNQVADEAGVELHQEMEGAKAVSAGGGWTWRALAGFKIVI
jgi:charged multivesicular body protein 1